MEQLNAINERGMSLIEQEDYSGALYEFRRGAQLAESAESVDPLIYGKLLNNAGYAATHLGQHVDAEKLFTRAVALHRRTNPLNNPELAISLQHLGRCAHRRGEYDRSWELWTQALGIWKRLVLEQKMGQYAVYLASAIHACGENMADRGAPEAARKNFEHALFMREKILPPTHADVIGNLINLGKLCAYLQDWEAAQQYLRRGIPLLEQS